ADHVASVCYECLALLRVRLAVDAPSCQHSLRAGLFFIDAASPVIYPLSLHDALPISRPWPPPPSAAPACPESTPRRRSRAGARRSEEHTSELQSRVDLVCRLLLEKKKLKTDDSTAVRTDGCAARNTER